MTIPYVNGNGVRICENIPVKVLMDLVEDDRFCFSCQ